VDEPPPRRQLDPRPSRFEQGFVALVLLAGFTFQLELLIPAMTALLAVSAAVGPRRAPLPRLYAAAAGNLLEPTITLVAAETLRLTVLIQTVVLLLATGLMFLGVGGLAWFIALVVVAGAVYDAVTGNWVEARLYRQLVHRRSI
jgi:hypothetical protein